MMTLWRTLQIAIHALSRNKTRSFLTVLGVIIGVAAVIAMVSIGEGAKARVAKTFESMGTNMLTVSSGSSRAGGARGGAGSQPTLTWDDMAAIGRDVPGVVTVAPQLRTGAQVVGELGNWQTSIVGTTPAWFQVRDWPMAQGEIFSAADNAAGRPVAILGKTVVDNLFGPGADPIGETVRINGIPFKVIAVAASKGSSAFGNDNDDTVIIPATTFGRRISGGLQKFLAGQIVVQTEPDNTAKARTGIEQLLRERHRLRADADDDFSVRDLSEIASAQQESAQTITSLLAGVALVSLLVGGIGIMNIMLVSVTERTREIGLRMAVGAKPWHILAQFLSEAMTLSIAGGLLGIAAGIGAAQYMAAKFGFPLLVRPDIVLLAVLVSAAVGIGFGMYPARKASRMAPITALRWE
jgi:putative ABC transport system permease protein